MDDRQEGVWKRLRFVAGFGLVLTFCIVSIDTKYVLVCFVYSMEKEVSVCSFFIDPEVCIRTNGGD